MIYALQQKQIYQNLDKSYPNMPTKIDKIYLYKDLFDNKKKLGLNISS